MIREKNPSWLNIVRFVIEDPARLKILLKKVAKRATGENVSGSPENDAWIAANSVPADEVASALNLQVWKEALEFGDEFRSKAELILRDIPYDLGGGSHHVFLYWLTRYLKPNVIVETGVAAGWSSRAFLAAVAKNCTGTLYSSDLPYFRLPKPERFVGILVEEQLRGNWVLQLDADEVNLPRILEQVAEVDIFHYDSDKMASGRNLAVNLVRDKLAPAGLIIMDDIWNDDWFRSYVTSEDLPHCVIDGRYGLIGELASQFHGLKPPKL
jgi:predicted O-methyltransferase YrrM